MPSNFDAELKGDPPQGVSIMPKAKRFLLFLLSILAASLCNLSALAAPRVMPPTVSNVTFSVQSGTNLVDVYCDLAEGMSAVSLAVSIDGGTIYAVPVTSVTGVAGTVSPWVGENASSRMPLRTGQDRAPVSSKWKCAPENQ